QAGPEQAGDITISYRLDGRVTHREARVDDRVGEPVSGVLPLLINLPRLRKPAVSPVEIAVTEALVRVVEAALVDADGRDGRARSRRESHGRRAADEFREFDVEIVDEGEQRRAGFRPRTVSQLAQRADAVTELLNVPLGDVTHA